MRFLGPDADATNEITTFDQLGDKIDCYTFMHQGTVTTGAGTSRKYVQYAGEIVAVRISVGTAPTGSSLIVDVNTQGTTITTSGNRATISASGFTGSTITFNGSQVMSAGQYISVDIDQRGSSTPGSDLVVDIYYKRS